MAYISAGHAGVWRYMELDGGASIWHTTYIGIFRVFLAAYMRCCAPICAYIVM